MMNAFFKGKTRNLPKAFYTLATAAFAASFLGSREAQIAAQIPPPAAPDPVANVIAFGADPSGERDSTQAFVEALASGEIVYVPAGHYKISNYDAIVLRKPLQELTGAGRTASVLDYVGPCQPTVDGSHSAITLSGPKEVVRDLGLTSTLPQKCILTGIRTISDHGIVDNVAVTQMWHAGVGLHGNYNSLIDSDIEYNYYGVAAGGDHLLIRGNYISNHYSTSKEPRPWTNKSMYWDGIAGEGLTKAVIDGNTVDDNGQSGIYTGGNHSVSSGNIISYNVVRHNRNEGIDQGVVGAVNASSNYLGKLIIVFNTSVDNFRRNIRLNEVDGAVVAYNIGSHTPDGARWWANDVRQGGDWANACQIATATKGSQSNDIVFVHNTCSQPNPAWPALLVNTGAGEGNIIGQNSVQGERSIAPNTDPRANFILPPK